VRVEGKRSRNLAVMGDPFTDLAVLVKYRDILRKEIPVLGFISYESLIYSELSLTNLIPRGEASASKFHSEIDGTPLRRTVLKAFIGLVGR